MKKLFGIIIVCVVAFFIWNAFDSTKPDLKAHVGINREAVSIKNCSDLVWPSPEITLNSAFDGPILKATDWPTGETRVLNFRDFKGKLNQQAFNPESDKVVKVLIDANGFQLGIYK